MTPTRAQCSTSAGWERISCAVLRPGTFQALDVDVAVTVCAAVSADSDAYGRCTAPGYTSGPWISSAKTRAPAAVTTSARASCSSTPKTRPNGLCGLTCTT